MVFQTLIIKSLQWHLATVEGRIGRYKNAINRMTKRVSGLTSRLTVTDK